MKALILGLSQQSVSLLSFCSEQICNCGCPKELPWRQLAGVAWGWKPAIKSSCSETSVAWLACVQQQSNCEESLEGAVFCWQPVLFACAGDGEL